MTLAQSATRRALQRVTRLTRSVLTLEAAAIAAVLALGAALRIVGLDWDQGHHQHPDERFLSMVLTQIQPAPDLWAYFDPDQSPLNPFNHEVSFFVYGTFPLFLVESLARALGRGGYDEAYLVGRALSALFDLGTVLLVYLLGRRLLGAWPAVLAAALLALAVHSIQIAHFFAVGHLRHLLCDAHALAAGSLQQLRRRAQPGAGRHRRGPGDGQQAEHRSAAGAVRRLVGADGCTGGRAQRHLGASRGVAGACGHVLAYSRRSPFDCFSPTRSPRPGPGIGGRPRRSRTHWRNNKPSRRARWTGRRASSGRARPPGSIRSNRSCAGGAGRAFGLAALAGLGLAAMAWWRTREHVLALPLAWAGLNFLVFGAFVLKTMRYFHPVYPVLALVTAWMFAWGWKRRERLSGLAGWGVGAALVVALGATLLWALAFMQIYGRDHTRAAASEFIHANAVPGTTIAVEHWDDELPLPLNGLNPDRFTHVQLRVYDPDDEAKRAHLIQTLSQADMVVLASDRGAATIPRMPQRYPLTGRYYAALDDGSLGFDLLARFESPTLAGSVGHR